MTSLLSGQGFDRHLFAMKYVQEKKGRELDEFYTEENYAKLNHIILSTSTLSSPAVQIGGFCPVVPDGYGIGTLLVPCSSCKTFKYLQAPCVCVGYAINSDNLGVVVTTYPDRNGSDFVSAFQESAIQMRNILEGNFKH